MMSNKFNNVGKNKLLKGLLVALPFVSLTPESEAAIPKKKVTVSRQTTTRMARGTQSTRKYAQTARAVKRAETRKARFQRVRVAKKVESEKAELQKVSAVKKAEARKARVQRASTAKKVEPGKAELQKVSAVKKAEARKARFQRASAAKKVEPGKARFQRARVVKKVEPGKAELQRPIIKKRMRATGVRRTVAPRNTQRTATVVSNTSYIRRLEARLDHALELFKKGSPSFTPPMSKAFDAIASSITKLGEMFDVWKKKEEQKIEKRLAKKAINKVVESEKNIEEKETTGNRINLAQKLPLLEQGLATKNSTPVVSETPEIAKTPASPLLDQGLAAKDSASVVSKTPEVAKKPANPLEAAVQLLGFELDKVYKDGEEALKVLGQKFYRKKNFLERELEKENNPPEKFAELAQELEDLENKMELLKKHISTKFGIAQKPVATKEGFKTAEVSVPPKAPPAPPKAPPAPPKAEGTKEPTGNAPGADVSKAPLVPASALAVLGPVDLNKTLLENLQQVDDTFIKKGQLINLLNKAEVPENEISDLFKIEDELLQSVNLSVQTIDTQINEINSKLGKNKSGTKGFEPSEYVYSLVRPPEKYWTEWNKDARDLFDQKINLTSQLIQKQYSLMLLVQADRLDRMVSSKVNKSEIKSRGDELLAFIKNMRGINTKVSSEVKTEERDMLIGMSKVLENKQKTLEESKEVFGDLAKKARPVSRFARRIVIKPGEIVATPGNIMKEAMVGKGKLKKVLKVDEIE